MTEVEETKLIMKYRQATQDIPVYGKVDRFEKLATWDGSEQIFAEFLGSQGAYVAWLEPEREP